MPLYDILLSHSPSGLPPLTMFGHYLFIIDAFSHLMAIFRLPWKSSSEVICTITQFCVDNSVIIKDAEFSFLEIELIHSDVSL